MDTDVIIVGGGPAGLTAALYLGRARKRVVVVDAGAPRHAVSEGVHNFLSRDGMAPAALREVSWEQMAAYPSVAHRVGTVVALEHEGGGWRAELAGGHALRARAVLLATGMIDEHPAIDGFAERWARSIHQCPYCHGWELRDRPLAALASGDSAAHYARMLRGWSDDVVLLTNGGELPAEARAELDAASMDVREAPLKALRGPGTELTHIELEDGTTLARRGLFVMSAQRQAPLIASLELETDEGGYVVTDGMGQTSRPMLWA
ncbi:MAG: NAD(P)/FAD-dependent oxidoreductase, partial [Myxococcota bacterium]